MAGQGLTTQAQRQIVEAINSEKKTARYHIAFKGKRSVIFPEINNLTEEELNQKGRYFIPSRESHVPHTQFQRLYENDYKPSSWCHNYSAKLKREDRQRNVGLKINEEERKRVVPLVVNNDYGWRCLKPVYEVDKTHRNITAISAAIYRRRLTDLWGLKKGQADARFIDNVN